MQSAAVKGTITDIQRFSVHDGPGIRTTVFLKGCNLRCFWCHNPETIHPRPELQEYPSRCIGCGACVQACQRGARVLEDGRISYHREMCRACGACAEVCYAEALTLVGRTVSAGEALAEVLADRPFYESSGGGVTISGGEPLFQAEFSIAVLALCRDAGIHGAVESNMAWPWERVEPLAAAADLVMMDVKTLDDARHRAWTGASNAQVLENAGRLAAMGKPLIVRTPVIPGVNDTPEAIGAIARFAAGLGSLLYYELLPFHPLAAGKYESLGMEYAAAGLARPPREQMCALTEAARAAGIDVRS